MKHTQLMLNRRSRGFTLVELAIVIIVLAILAAYFARSLWGAREDTQVSLSVTFLENTVPRAIAALQARQGFDLSSVDDLRQALIDRGLDPQTVFGEDWDAEFNAGDRTVRFEYPVTGDIVEEAEIVRDDIETALTPIAETPQSVIEAVQVQGDDVVVTYRTQ